MDILRKDLPLSSLILADALIAAGDELYCALVGGLSPLPEHLLEALTDYALASNAYRASLKPPEPSHATPPQPPAGA